MMAVLKQRVAHGRRAADEQATIKPVLFTGDSLAAAIPANQDNRCEARGRFVGIHFKSPDQDQYEGVRLPGCELLRGDGGAP
jgi:hypothetical protein